MSYLVLARKYRSTTFEEVVGQEHIAGTLRNAIASGRIAHAFLFGGTRGVGKTTMARILAKALNCLSAEQPISTPCNTCDACVAIARGDDVDVVEIDGASNRGIDEIRELRANAIYRPNRCRYKIYYIDEVHMLTKDAFNALLKTLEEPPGHVKFIFATTEPDRLPATILSRCQRYDFRDIPTAAIAAHLRTICGQEKVQADDGAIFRVARAARGSMRDALSLMDQLMAAGGQNIAEADVVAALGTPPDERTFSIVSAIAGGDTGGALRELDALLAGGVTMDSAVGAVGEMFRHMMLLRVCGTDSPLVELPESQRLAAADLANRFSVPALVGAVTVCETTARNLRGLTCGRGLLEAALVRLAASDQFVDAASLVERLERMEGRPAPGAAGRGSYSSSHGAAGPAAGQKKKVEAPPPQRPPAAAPTPAAAVQAPTGADRPGEAPSPSSPPDALPWHGPYVRDHWADIVAALQRRRPGGLCGLISPAKVLALDGETIDLGYDRAHEAVRVRAEASGGALAAALGELFARTVRCRFVGTGEEGAPPASPRGAGAVSLSSAERAAVDADPAVKAVTDFFGGAIYMIQPAAPAADAADE